MGGRLGGPGEGVHSLGVAGELCGGIGGDTDVNDDDFVAVEHHCGKIVRVKRVPGESEERDEVRALVGDGAMVEVPQVEKSQASIGTDRRKDVATF